MLQVVLYDKIIKNLQLPSTLDHLRNQLRDYPDHNIVYVQQSVQITLTRESDFVEACRVQQLKNPATTPMVVHLQHPLEFMPEKNSEIIPQQASLKEVYQLQPPQFLFADCMGESTVPNEPKSGEFKMTRSVDLDEPKPCLFAIFFSESQSITCKCANSQQQCHHCKGTKQVSLGEYKDQLEEILKRKLTQRFAQLKERYLAKYGVELRDVNHFMQECFKRKPTQPQSQAPSGLRPPKKSPNKDTDRRTSNISAISNKSSNSSQVRPEPNQSPNQFHRKNAPRQQTQNLKLPNSGRQSQEMMGSVRSVLSTAQSPLTTSQLGQSTMVNSKMPKYNARIELLNESKIMVEPGLPIICRITITNNGVVQWPPDTRLKRTDEGDQEDFVRSLGPNEYKQISVQFPSSQKQGTYRTDWRLCYPQTENPKERAYFGSKLYIEYTVMAPPRPEKSQELIEALRNIMGGDYHMMAMYVAKVLSVQPFIEKEEFMNMVLEDNKDGKLFEYQGTPQGR